MSKIVSTSTPTVFYCKISNNLIWSQWTPTGASLTGSFVYKIIWPDEKDIKVS